MQKIVLAYSGGLDTSVIVTWLRENYDCEVITFTGSYTVTQADFNAGFLSYIAHP